MVDSLDQFDMDKESYHQCRKSDHRQGKTIDLSLLGDIVGAASKTYRLLGGLIDGNKLSSLI